MGGLARSRIDALLVAHALDAYPSNGPRGRQIDWSHRMSEDELLLQARRFQVVRRHRLLADGSPHSLECVLHPGAVTVLPLVEPHRVCLIRNFRPAVGATLCELPAGTLEPGEDPLAAAGRELEEETGYRAGRIEPLAEFWMSPGILRERMHVFVATELVATAPHREAGEEIETLVVAWDEALELVRRGEIQDAKSIAALLLLDQRRRGPA
jgi:ADP-ribose pyrophosphatase